MHTQTKTVVQMALMALLAGWGGAHWAAAAGPPAPDALPGEIRALLGPRMQRHGDDMEELLWAVLLLSRDAAADIAEDMASEPRVAPPTADMDLANSRVPPRFLALQQQLFVQTRALRDAAARSDDPAMAEAFGALSSTCVQCHTAYLGRPAGAAESNR
jgi:hypothetical protein